MFYVHCLGLYLLIDSHSGKTGYNQQIKNIGLQKDTVIFPQSTSILSPDTLMSR